ncbi:hypothetical protein AMATHDRAFT_157122, partial [Amanita thiersii Skay4041]
IRVNLYITILLLAVIPITPSTLPLLSALASNAGVSGAALLITALIGTAKHQLSFFHAIFIVHALNFLGIGVSPTGEYKGNVPLRVALSLILSFGLMFTYLGWAMYVFTTATKFGQSPECNSKISYFVFYGVKVSVTTRWLRRFWLAMLGITLALLVLMPFCACCCLSLNRPAPTSCMTRLVNLLLVFSP